MSTALITGASRGIGRAIAVCFAKAGYDVAFCYSKDDIGAKETARLIRETGKEPLVYKVDVTNEKQVKEMIESVFSLEVLINNAGVALYQEFCDTSLSQWKNIFSVNVEGAFLCSKYAIEKMRKREKGAIINISSIWGETGASMEVAYSASKAALIGMSKALAKEVAPSNITVNCISAGIVDTDMNSHLSKEDISNFLLEVPAGRVALPEEIAKGALFLAENNYITGEVLRINGGFLI